MRYISRFVMVVLIFTLLGNSGQLNINIGGMEIKKFIEMVGKLTKKNILVSEDVKGKISFYLNNNKLDNDDLIPLLNAILETKKLTMINQGDYYEVIRSTEAPGKGLPIKRNRVQSDEGTMQTVIFKLNRANAGVMRTKIKSLLPKSAKVISFKSDNLLAVTAFPRTLKAIKQLIDTIENSDNKLTKVVPLRNAYVKNIFLNIQTMARTLFPQDIPSQRVTVMKDEASNSIILIGSRDNVSRLEEYVREMDVRGEDEDMQRMYVIPLKNSNVEDMEKILSKILPQMTDNVSMGTINAVSKGAKSAVPRTPRAVPTKKRKIKKAVIASDLERNALIVLANTAQIKNIKETIRVLDIEKPQVYIKAKIVEVNTNLASRIGVKYGLNGSAITSKGLFSILASSGAEPLEISSELMGFLNQGSTRTIYNSDGNPIGTETTSNFSFEEGIKQIFSIGLQLDLLKQNGAAQVLSEPSILCTNNKESTIYVGKTKSFLKNSQQSTQGNSNIINTYSREDIGITLKVKPRLSSNNKVSLEVETKIEDIEQGSGASTDRPTTIKRTVKTNAIVNNAETIILGGLIRTATGKSYTKVPILGDIPIIGQLFRSEAKEQEKTNVVIYLTPYIVEKSSDLVTLRKNLEELDSIQEKFNKIVLNELEKRRLGIIDEKTHVTFSTKPLLRAKGYSGVDSENYILDSATDIEIGEGSGIRSESVLETLERPSREIDLNSIDTEINPETGFEEVIY
ncbi:MAG: type II secretion system secretin GspD [Epsilonproteobacteria bacterium]|nr:type II secretion system secretin GspD [Campylobacterota bacterium]